ncbi:hypothetical protein BDZ89DRAFT_684493 [Hymenopellis radicata]|nr:hypothetical protein BDZ89DRAFT_684493 [Hymenopellis radicata]
MFADMNANQDASMPDHKEQVPASTPTPSGLYFKKLFHNSVFECSSITAWAKAMSGLTDSEIQEFYAFIATDEWKFSGSALADYELALNKKDNTYIDLYGPFQRLCNDFLERLDAAELPGDLARPSESGVRVWHHAYGIAFISKRDWETLPHRQYPHCITWGNVVFPMDIRLNVHADEEVASTHYRGPYAGRYDAGDEEEQEVESLEENVPSARPDVPQCSHKKRIFPGKRRMEWDFHEGSPRPTKRARIDAQVVLATAKFIPTSSIDSSPPRRRYQSMFADIPATHDRVGWDPEYFNNDDRTLVKSQIRCRESRITRGIQWTCLTTYRFFTFGLFVENYQVTLWYFDSTGAMHSAAFHLLRQKRELMLLLFVLNRMTPAQAGFNPFQHPGGMDVGVAATHLAGSEFTFMRYDVKTGDTDYLNYKTAGTAALSHSLEMAGRRTYVVALQGDLVVKFAWIVRDEYVRPETHYIEKILKRSPKLRGHLPQVHLADVYDDSLKLPRWRLATSDEDLRRMQMRDLSVMVTQRYQALWEVDTLEEFKTAFIDVFECHHEAYINGRVLHRDISDNNLMFQRCHGRIYGVLMDFDNALDLSMTNAPNEWHSGTQTIHGHRAPQEHAPAPHLPPRPRVVLLHPPLGRRPL